MGILDLFGSRESREQASLKKLGQKITQKWGPAENRQNAIEQLGENGTPAALKVLCLRFTVRAEVGISDDDEKEQARAILVAAGAKARGAGPRVPRGAGVGRRLGPPGAGLAGSPRGAPRHRARHPPEARPGVHARSGEEAGPALLAARAPGAARPWSRWAARRATRWSSRCSRISWTTCASARPGRSPSGTPSEAARDALIALLLRDRDNARVRGEVLQALVDLGADVKGHRSEVETLLVEPWYLDREGRVKRRGA